MNKLDQLRTMTDVVADTGDINAIEQFKPVDATTNPSLLLKTASDTRYQYLMDESVNWAKGLELPDDEKLSALSDRYAVAVGAEILKLVPGRVSTEVDARLSFDIAGTVAKAHRLIALYDDMGIGKERVLIKIAATWEGICAAKQLEAEGINCNLTLLFSSVQAVAAAEAGAFLISPFVGRILDWYKQANGVDGYPATEDPGVLSVQNIYNLYKSRGYQTVVMGASFRNVGEIEQLAGCDRLTIGPNFLQELETEGDLPRILNPDNLGDFTEVSVVNEADFRLQLNDDAMATEKLAQGIRAFVTDQVKLELLLKNCVDKAC